MSLRHVLLLGSGVGAAGALLLAADIHRRVQEAQRDVAVNTTTSGADSVLHFGDAHTLGLLALAFIFIAMFLMVISEPLRKSVAETPTAAPLQTEAAKPVDSVATVPAAPLLDAQPALEQNSASTPSAAPPATETPNISETKETSAEPDAV